MNALTANFREEIQKTHPDIQISLVSPGVVKTEFGVHALHGGPDSRQLPDSQTAEKLSELLAFAEHGGGSGMAELLSPIEAFQSSNEVAAKQAL